MAGIPGSQGPGFISWSRELVPQLKVCVYDKTQCSQMKKKVPEVEVIIPGAPAREFED